MTQRQQSPLQAHLYKIIFGTDTPSGKWFDLILIFAILISVGVIIGDSMANIHRDYGALLQRLEWGFTLLFTLEYMLRIWIARNRRAYIFSLYGLIDLLAILPSYLAIMIPQTAPLLIIRLLRVLRVFRVLRLVGYLNDANQIAGVLRSSWRQIFVFFSIVITIIVVFGCLIYVLEGPNNGFENIPVSVYWAIVTVTTVGYGDVVPVTAAGRAISALAMLVGYAIIAVPTGIFTANIIEKRQTKRTPLNCPQCSRAGHEEDARYCRHCGSYLRTDSDEETTT
ncbi:MAG: voltage-gated potassium channel [Glaciecola sp.]|jgi:voltage-gated potassium channel|uniref:ion transporter n=1 Tax=Congregibacter sp. TaxID=2744308 RepID=UPI0039E3E2E4